MNEQLNKICEQIEALPEDATVEFRLIDGRTNTLLDSWDIDDLKALASYALRVEKMLNSVGVVDIGTRRFIRDNVRFGNNKWSEYFDGRAGDEYDTLVEAFEATQNVSDGREIQGASRGINQEEDTAPRR